MDLIQKKWLKPGSHLCDKHNTSEISISTRKKETFLLLMPMLISDLPSPGKGKSGDP